MLTKRIAASGDENVIVCSNSSACPVLQKLGESSSARMPFEILDSLLTLLNQVFSFECFAMAALSILVSLADLVFLACPISLAIMALVPSSALTDLFLFARSYLIVTVKGSWSLAGLYAVQRFLLGLQQLFFCSTIC